MNNTRLYAWQALLYARIVFPTMVFVGVADIDPSTIDRSVVLVMLLAKVVTALVVVAFALPPLRRRHGSDALAHAGALAQKTAEKRPGMLPKRT